MSMIYIENDVVNVLKAPCGSYVWVTSLYVQLRYIAVDRVVP